jgi:hypothetical protein
VIGLVVILSVIVLGLSGALLREFRVGSDQSRAELSQVRRDANQERRRLHDLTREAFVAMSEEAERRRQP